LAAADRTGRVPFRWYDRITNMARAIFAFWAPRMRPNMVRRVRRDVAMHRQRNPSIDSYQLLREEFNGSPMT